MSWTEEQLHNAQIIYQVGQQLGATPRDIQIAIMAALVESGLQNLDYGDRDSIGMFQQRDAWGSREARLDPYRSAKMFFLGGAAGQRGLLDFANRTTMSPGEAAQAVQVSAFPDRYAMQQDAADTILKKIGASPDTLPAVDVASLDAGDVPQLELPKPPTLTEVNGVGEITADAAGIGAMQFGSADAPTPLDALQFGSPVVNPMEKLAAPSLDALGVRTTPVPGGTDVASGWRGQIVASARKMLGTPYVWGGSSYSGVDCSGLIYLLYNQRGFDLPRVSADQARSGQRIDFSALKPGDLVAVDNSSRNYGADHIGIYIGNGQVIHAPHPGSVVQIGSLADVFGGGWGIRIHR